jgi:hypothetical protein
MMRSRRLAAIADLLCCACVDFDETRRKYCESITPEKRAEICQDGPQVVATNPLNSADKVALSARITVTFNQAVVCDGAGIGLKRSEFGVEVTVEGTTTCPADASQAIFTPSMALLSMRSHKATLTQTIKNEQGIPVTASPPYSWTFTTQ